ncbi:MAG TPA: SpoIIE family protein phosphatase [Polyangia bacterium]|nr:SpoIIE family protein phosphatase [Polyangia bacterium]
MKFRTLLLAALVALVGVTIVATLLAVSGVIDHYAEADLADKLERGRRVFEDVQRYRSTLYRAESRAVADEPRLKAAVDTQEVSQETVLGVAVDLRKAIQSDLFLLTDGTGHLVADVADPKASGFDLSKNSEVGAALQSGDGFGIWTHDAHAYQVQAHRLTFGSTAVGVVVIGYELDDRVADSVTQQTGDLVVVELDGAPIAASLVDGRILDRGTLRAALMPVADRASTPTEIRLAGQRFLAVASPFPGRHEGQKAMRYWVLASIDRALEAKRRITRTLWGIAGLSTLLAVLLAFVMSRLLSRPIDALVAATRQISTGDLGARVEPSGARELRVLGASMNRMAEELAQSRDRLAEQQRLQKELEIATRIQTSILPKAPRLDGLEIAARMLPAEDVGGDYYDVLPSGHGGWLGIGDVAGHGLTAGLVMMMIQGIVSSLIRERPDASPSELLCALNRVLYENIHDRLAQDEHVTLTLMRYEPSGKLWFAGAHEEMVVCRAAGGPCERIGTPGTWVGAIPDISANTTDGTIALGRGDLLVLYTDGLIQAMDKESEQFGMDRLCRAVEERRSASVDDICAHVLDAVGKFQNEQVDDVTLLVIRYTGLGTSSTEGGRGS